MPGSKVKAETTTASIPQQLLYTLSNGDNTGESIALLSIQYFGSTHEENMLVPLIVNDEANW
jgi:hypothetical protein